MRVLLRCELELAQNGHFESVSFVENRVELQKNLSLGYPLLAYLSRNINLFMLLKYYILGAPGWN